MTELPGAGALAILAVPCNQFGHQEPAKNRTELLRGLYHVRPGNSYVPLFHVTARSDINGNEELQLYRYLKLHCPAPLSATFSRTQTFWEPLRPHDVSWNFEKFLVGPDGQPAFRFMPNVEPFDLRNILQNFSALTSDQVNAELALVDQTVAKRVADRKQL